MLWFLDKFHDSRSPSRVLSTFNFRQCGKGCLKAHLRISAYYSHIFGKFSLMSGLGKLSDTGKMKSFVARWTWV